jgi:uncharacterized membrane protein YgdD (TMEM256/DUF423 family)
VTLHWLAVGAIVWALAIAAGAFGAHALAERVDQRALELWETATRYAVYGALLLGVLGLAARLGEPRLALRTAAWALLLGVAIFSGTLGAMALGAPRWLGAITPLGGLLLIAGALFFAYWAWQAAATRG